MPVTFPSKLALASVRDNCPATFDETPTHSCRDYLYLLDNAGDFIRDGQGFPIIIGNPPTFSTKLGVASCRD